MSKLRCQCGHILSDSDQESFDNLWGEITPNEKQFKKNEKLAKLMFGLYKAYKEEKHINWVKENYNVYAEQNIESIIFDLISSETLDVGVTYARCTKCDTLMIQEAKDINRFVPYQPTEANCCKEI